MRFLGPETRFPVSYVYGLDRGTPIDRVYIGRFIKDHFSDVRGTVFEIGEKRYSRDIPVSAETKTYSVGLAKNVDLRIDLADKTQIPEFLADSFICTQTLNFIFPLAETVQGLHRWIRPGGKLICTVGGISALSSYDAQRWGHYWSFTPQSATALFCPTMWTDIKVVTYGNYFSAQSFLAGLALEDLKHPEWLDDLDERYPVVIGISATRI